MSGFRNDCSRASVAGCTTSAIYRFVHLQIPEQRLFATVAQEKPVLLLINCLNIAAGNSESSENQTTAKPADL